jgi:anti-anti-sigma factor
MWASDALAMSGDQVVGTRMHGDVASIDINGDVTAQTGTPIEEAYRHVTASGATKIVLCFGQASYINSGGIAVLIEIVSAARQRGQTVRMAGVSPHFQKIFNMVGLTRYAKAYGSEEAALKDF